ncbi:MAG: phasin family protein [Pseudomarimonas sp.]
MAKFKSAAKGKSSEKASPKAKNPAELLQAKAEVLSKSIMDSAQQIWMAGMGAFGRAQGEGTKMFESLVAEGVNLEKRTRNLATGKVDAVRDAVESRVGQVKERAADTWDKLEKVFEDRVQRALVRLGVPGRDDLKALIQRVDQLNAELRKLGSKSAAPAAAKPASKPAAKAAAKVVAKPVAKKATKSVTAPKAAAPTKAAKASKPAAKPVVAPITDATD